MATKKRDNFNSTFLFVMAMAGSAIGLGNIWRFPYMVGQYGGAIFILMYIICGVCISLPAFVSESLIGRKARTSCYNAFVKLAPGTSWKYIGILAFLGTFIITSYYSVVGGWSLEYLFRSVITGLDTQTEEEAGELFRALACTPWMPAAFFTIFLGLSFLIVKKGMTEGVGKFTKWSTPLLFVIIVVVVLYSLTLPGAGKGVEYLVKPDWSQLSFKTLAFAMGQSFFSLSLGMGTVLVYSSFMKKEESVTKIGLLTFLFDTSFAIIAGFAIMPAVFAAGIEPGSGPSLVFETIPYIFTKMGLDSPILSRSASILFFLTIFLAAISSEISVIAVGVEHLVDRKNWSRKKACLLYFGFAWILGIICSLSFGPLSNIKLADLNIFSICDTTVSNVLMPLIALLFVLFTGWKMPKSEVYSEFSNNGQLGTSSRLFPFIYFTIKWLLPVVIVVIFFFNLL